MKKGIVVGVLVLINLSLSSQISVGPKVNILGGQVVSKNLKESIAYRNQIDPEIKTWDIKYKYGTGFGFGGFFQYDISEALSGYSELTYNVLQHKITMDYFKNSIDSKGDGSKKTITSEAQLKFTYVNLPIYLKYKLNKLYFLGGFSFNFIGKREISSVETKTVEDYTSGILDGYNTSADAAVAELNVFKTTRTDFTLAVGTFFDLAGNQMNIDVRYNIPLTKTEMYTTSIGYDDNVFKNNEHFDFWGKADAEARAPQYPLNDFKLGTISLSISYTLFQN